MKIDKVDTLTAQSMAEFDIAKRQETAKEVERELLKAYGAGEEQVAGPIAAVVVRAHPVERVGVADAVAGDPLPRPVAKRSGPVREGVVEVEEDEPASGHRGGSTSTVRCNSQ